MGFFLRLLGLGGYTSSKPGYEQAVLVYLPLSDDDWGTVEEGDAIHAFSDVLEKAILQAGVGEFDGDEFGEGRCIMYMYGPDADALFAAIEPALRASPLTRGGYATKRYGGPPDRDLRTVRIEL